MEKAGNFGVNTNRQRGFTLIELMVVVAILGIFAAAMTYTYRRDTSKDDLIKEAEQVTSILRGASTMGGAMGRNVVVIIQSSSPNIRAFIDKDFSQTYTNGVDTLLAEWTKTSSKVNIDYIDGTTGTLEFVYRGDARYNYTIGGSAPNYDAMTKVFLRLTTNPTASQSDDNGWYTFKLWARTGSVQVIRGYAT